MEDEAIYILTKLKIKNYLKTKGKYIKLTYNELLDYTIKALRIMERCKNGRIKKQNNPRYRNK